MKIYIHNCVWERACVCPVVSVVDIVSAGILYVDLGTFAKDMTKNIQVGLSARQVLRFCLFKWQKNKITLYCHIFN